MNDYATRILCRHNIKLCSISQKESEMLTFRFEGEYFCRTRSSAQLSGTLNGFTGMITVLSAFSGF